MKFETGYLKKPKVAEAVLVIDRFKTICRQCNAEVKREATICSFCGVKFTHVSTNFSCGWMQSTIKVLRPDLIYLEPGKVFSNSELII